MDNQVIFNVVIGLSSTAMGWWLNTMWESIKALQLADKELAEKVASIEVLVAGRYVTRDEFNNSLSQVSAKLDRIIDTLNKKADR